MALLNKEHIVIFCIIGGVILVVSILSLRCLWKKYIALRVPNTRQRTKSYSIDPSTGLTRNTNPYPGSLISKQPSNSWPKTEEDPENVALLPPNDANHCHDLDMVDDYILSEKIKDIIEMYHLKYENSNNEMQDKICEELNILWDNTVLYQRVQNVIFDLQQQHGVFNKVSLSSQQSVFIEDEDLKLDEDIKLDMCDDKPDLHSLFKRIKNMYIEEMGTLLMDYNEQRLIDECNSDKCNEFIQVDIHQCPCIRRICVFLKIYRQFYSQINTPHILPQMGDCFVVDGYNLLTLSNDFQHIQRCHMSNNHKMQRFICSQIIEKYDCKCIQKCNILKRRKKSRSAILFPSKLDHIHSYFFHSTLRLGCKFDPNNNSNSIMDDHKDDEEKSTTLDIFHQKKANIYGGKEDIQWLESINDIDIRKENAIYRRLLQRIDVFRWQGTTGFTYNNRGALCHLQPKWKNVKEEALYNIFSAVSIDTWNQMLRKATEFKKTSNARRIRTKQNGSFTDKVFGHAATWVTGESASIKEIVVVKLYTDLDTLQSELKKCFRLETRNDLLRRYTMRSSLPPKIQIQMTKMQKSESYPLPASLPKLQPLQTQQWDASMLRRSASSMHADEKNVINTLEQRLSQFCHWRGALVVFIHKYSTILQPRYYDTRKGKELEFVLYHGINSKMILNPSATQSFHGPLSTTSSYYVAESFATSKGMVLAITSQYPRLKMCKAFDASLISDYPEEQEWLIAHIYMRIRKIYTKKLPQYIMVETKIKHVFIAIHLFREQMFSMNRVLEDCIIPFIQIHLLKVAHINFDSPTYKHMEKSDGYKYLSDVINWHKEHKMDIEHSPDIKGVFSMNKEDEMEKNRIFYLLNKKFEEFCRVPNKIQTIKMDCISSQLKPYFLDSLSDENESKEILDNGGSWGVSFEKIINLFPDIKEIHFLNWYRFDNVVLEKLIAVIKKEDYNLRQIKFLYFDFRGSLLQHRYFFDPNHLKPVLVKKLKELYWSISYPNNKDPKNGYCIKLKGNVNN